MSAQAVANRTADEMRARRGDFTTPGTDSPYRQRTPAENLARLGAPVTLLTDRFSQLLRLDRRGAGLLLKFRNSESEQEDRD